MIALAPSSQARCRRGRSGTSAGSLRRTGVVRPFHVALRRRREREARHDDRAGPPVGERLQDSISPDVHELSATTWATPSRSACPLLELGDERAVGEHARFVRGLEPAHDPFETRAGGPGEREPGANAGPAAQASWRGLRPAPSHLDLAELDQRRRWSVVVRSDPRGRELASTPQWRSIWSSRYTTGWSAASRGSESSTTRGNCLRSLVIFGCERGDRRVPGGLDDLGVVVQLLVQALAGAGCR